MDTKKRIIKQMPLGYKDSYKVIYEDGSFGIRGKPVDGVAMSEGEANPPGINPKDPYTAKAMERMKLKSGAAMSIQEADALKELIEMMRAEEEQKKLK